MPVPYEFTTEAIAAASEGWASDRVDYLASGEPYASLHRNNPWTKPPAAGSQLEWGRGWYYDTTVARKHPVWMNEDLPRPTKVLSRLRADLDTWGYCLIEEGVSASQCQALYDRASDQAAAERALGVAYLSPAQQHVWSLINKGEMFLGCMEHDPSVVQAGPLIERMLDDNLGPGWQHFSFLANISYPGCHPQGLHQDQSFFAPFVVEEAPALMNTIYILQDVDEVNGGTLIVPGSHRTPARAGEVYGRLPAAINLEAPAGTILMMDGRTLHAGAVNRSDRLRYIITNSTVKPWVRQQECFHLGVSQDVLSRASPKLLMRLGFMATSVRSMVEGYGYRGDGRAGDPNGSLVHVRHLMDQQGYRHMGPLSMSNLEGARRCEISLRAIQDTHETFRSERYAERLETVSRSHPPKSG